MSKPPDLDRLRRQVMSLQEADAAVRYIEELEAAIEFPSSQPSPQATEVEGMVSADWHGLTAILDKLYPADVFTGDSLASPGAGGDLGARIVALARKLTEATWRGMKAEAAAVDLARSLAEIARRPSIERNPDGEDQAADTMKLIARDALARYPEFTPEGYDPIAPRTIEVFSDRDGDCRWRLIADDRRTLLTSPTRYPTRASARVAAEREALRFGLTDIVDDE